MAGYKIEHVPKARRQLEVLSAIAVARQSLDKYLATMRGILHELELRPTLFGEAERRIADGRGVVYRGGRSPVFVRYIVFESQCSVTILSFLPMPSSWLAID